MAKYIIVRFNDKYAVKKTTFWGMFTEYVDLTNKDTFWMCWKKGKLCFGNCLGTYERAEYVLNLTKDGIVFND